MVRVHSRKDVLCAFHGRLPKYLQLEVCVRSEGEIEALYASVRSLGVTPVSLKPQGQLPCIATIKLETSCLDGLLDGLRACDCPVEIDETAEVASR